MNVDRLGAVALALVGGEPPDASQSDLGAALGLILPTLPSRRRSAFEGVVLGGRRQVDVASALGVSQPTVCREVRAAARDIVAGLRCWARSEGRLLPDQHTRLNRATGVCTRAAEELTLLDGLWLDDAELAGLLGEAAALIVQPQLKDLRRRRLGAAGTLCPHLNRIEQPTQEVA